MPRVAPAEGADRLRLGRRRPGEPRGATAPNARPPSERKRARAPPRGFRRWRCSTRTRTRSRSSSSTRTAATEAHRLARPARQALRYAQARRRAPPLQGAQEGRHRARVAPAARPLFASGGHDGAIHFWSTLHDEPLGSAVGQYGAQAHEGAVWSLAWHPLGHLQLLGRQRPRHQVLVPRRPRRRAEARRRGDRGGGGGGADVRAGGGDGDAAAAPTRRRPPLRSLAPTCRCAAAAPPRRRRPRRRR